MKRPARIVAGPIAQRIGDALSVDVDIDVVTLPVSSPAEFDEAGGWLVVVDDAGAEHVLEYVAVSDDELHVELAEPLPVALPAGRRVDVWDTTTAAPIVEYVADVAFDDQLEGDPVPAVVKAGLIERLRGDVSGLVGSAVTIERQDPRPNDPDEDTELYVDEIDGQQSYLSLENADPDTAPDGLADAAPTSPPTTSPAVTVLAVPGNRGLYVRLDPPPGTWESVEVTTSRTPSFEVVEAAVTTTSSTVLLAPVPTNTDLWLRARLFNDVGSAPTGVVVGPHRVFGVESLDIADLSLTVRKFNTAKHAIY